MRDSYMTRQSDIITRDMRKTRTLLVGCGAIGSACAMCLAKSGMGNITMYDDDVVSTENIGVQWFRVKDIGKDKSSSLASIIHEFTSTHVNHKCMIYPEDIIEQYDVAILATDSMFSRMVASTYIQRHKNARLIIDARMSSEKFLIYTCDTSSESSVKNYNKTLHTDDEGVDERCTARSTMYNSMLIAPFVVKCIKDFMSHHRRGLKSVVCDIRKNNIRLFKHNTKNISSEYNINMSHGHDSQTKEDQHENHV